MSAALVVFGICLPLTAFVWRGGHILQQAEFLAYKAGKHREQAEATSKQAHEIIAASHLQIEALKSQVNDLGTKVARLEQGRVLQERRA